MAIEKKEIDKLKAQIKEKLKEDISERITKVEFISKSDNKVYFHTEDEDTPIYTLHIFSGGYETKMRLKSLDEVLKQFRSYQKMGISVKAYEGDKLIQSFTKE